MSCSRVLLCVLLPPLAVLDRGCGSIALVLVLTLCGWVPGALTALMIVLLPPPAPPAVGGRPATPVSAPLATVPLPVLVLGGLVGFVAVAWVWITLTTALTTAQRPSPAPAPAPIVLPTSGGFDAGPRPRPTPTGAALPPVVLTQNAERLRDFAHQAATAAANPPVLTPLPTAAPP